MFAATLKPGADHRAVFAVDGPDTARLAPGTHRIVAEITSGGTVIRMPKAVTHVVGTAGDQPVEGLVLYAAPLGSAGFVEVPRR